MRHISDVIISYIDDAMAELEKLQHDSPNTQYHVEPGVAQFYSCLQAILEHPAWQQISLVRMSIPQPVATRLSLRHNQMVEVYGKDIRVQVRPFHSESKEYSYSMFLYPIE